MMKLLPLALAIALSAPALAQDRSSSQTGTDQIQQSPAASGTEATTQKNEARSPQDEGRKRDQKLDKPQENPPMKKRSRQDDCKGPAALCKQDSAK